MIGTRAPKWRVCVCVWGDAPKQAKGRAAKNVPRVPIILNFIPGFLRLSERFAELRFVLSAGYFDRTEDETAFVCRIGYVHEAKICRQGGHTSSHAKLRNIVRFRPVLSTFLPSSWPFCSLRTLCVCPAEQ